MNDIEKQILKELLNHLIDKTQPDLVKDLIAKLPEKFQVIAASLSAVLEPMAVQAEHDLVNKI